MQSVQQCGIGYIGALYRREVKVIVLVESGKLTGKDSSVSWDARVVSWQSWIYFKCHLSNLQLLAKSALLESCLLMWLFLFYPLPSVCSPSCRGEGDTHTETRQESQWERGQLWQCHWEGGPSLVSCWLSNREKSWRLVSWGRKVTSDGTGWTGGLCLPHREYTTTKTDKWVAQKFLASSIE